MTSILRYPITCLPLLVLALFLVSACSGLPGDARAPGQHRQVASCSWLEGYPDCHRSHAPDGGAS
jgi:hypothetical protein